MKPGTRVRRNKRGLKHACSILPLDPDNLPDWVRAEGKVTDPPKFGAAKGHVYVSWDEDDESWPINTDYIEEA